jgi:hypothetical protein
MQDVIYIAVGFALFALACAFVRACAALKE